MSLEPECVAHQTKFCGRHDIVSPPPYYRVVQKNGTTFMAP